MLYLLTLSSVGCVAAPVPVRVLHTEAPRVQLPDSAPTHTAPRPEHATPKPRIGAPGGSGAGSRRVLPTQSGNETVGGLPGGAAGGGKGAGGRG